MRPTEGLNLTNDILFANIPLYIGLFSGNTFAPSLADTAASIVGDAEEIMDYAELTRPLFNISGNVSANGVISNSANPATFTFTNNVTVYGAFLSTNPTKGATTGIIMDVALFNTYKAYLTDDVLNHTYQLTTANP